MEEDDLHISRINTAWSMVREAHGDHTAVQSAQQRLLERYGGAVRKYALSALRNEDAAEDVFQEFALKFVRGDFGNADPERGRFRAFVKTVVYRLIVDYQRRVKKLGREGAVHSNIAEPADSEDTKNADEAFRTSWRDELLTRCWQRLEADQRNGRKICGTGRCLRRLNSRSACCGGKHPERSICVCPAIKCRSPLFRAASIQCIYT